VKTLQRNLTAAMTAALVGCLSVQTLHAAPRFGGGYRGGGSFRSPSDFRSGYQGSHPTFGANTRSNWGTSSRLDDAGNRFDTNGNRVNDSFDNDRFNRNVNVDNNFYNRDGNGFNRNWSNGGYWNNRPWNTGWFDGAGRWGWWGASSAAWGVAGLATGAVIGGLVNAAANQQSPVFMVPNTGYELDYSSVEGVGSYGVSFNYLVNGSQLMGAANCQQGLLNGQVPSSSSQAQLLNAVCQVAYGNGT
jgi:hypothetical protein